MRAHPRASLIWLLVLAVWCLTPLHDAWGASVMWSKSATGERLVFTFASSLPSGKPRKVSGGRILIPIGWSFWKGERKPGMPKSLPDSALFRSLEVYQSGLGLKIGGPFEFTSSSDARAKTLTIELRDLRQAVRTGAVSADAPPVSANASQTDDPPPSPNATSQGGGGSEHGPRTASNATVLQDASADAESMAAPALRIVSRRVAPGQVFRSRIIRSGQDVDTLDTQNSSVPATLLGPGDLFRQPIARVLPEELRHQAGNATERSDPAAPGTAGPSVAPVAVVSARREGVASGTEPVLSSAETAPAALNGTRDLVPASAGNASNATAGDVVLDAVGNATAFQANATIDVTAANATNASQEENATLVELQDQLALAQQALGGGQLAAAREILEGMLRRSDVPDELREELLFMVADILMQEGKGDLVANFPKILAAYEAAKNFDPPADRLPEALGNIGYLHLAVGNVPEAKGYFDYLRRRFPQDSRVPMIDYYWGEHYAARGALQKAADHFQYVLQNHPASEAAEPSAIGLLRCLADLGYADKAHELAGRIETQWPGAHLRYPGFLMAAGNAALTTDHLDKARDYFWTYYNVYPQSPDADMALVRIGDIFVKTGQHGAARDTFHKAAQEYPNREGGLIAQMRLAEEGLLAPTADFIGPLPRKPDLDPEAVYGRILKDPRGSLAPVARLKLAMWYLWNKRYESALQEAARFEADYPDHDLLPNNSEVQDKAIREWILTSQEAGDFPAVLRAWDQYGQLVRKGGLDPRIRLAVATALLETDQKDKGLDMAKPLVLGKPRNAYSEPGLDLMLSNLVDLKRWPEVVEVTREASTWNLSPDKQRLLDYAAGLAHENLDQHQDSRKFWSKLSTDMNLPEDRRAYALYFLARDAMAAGDVERAGILAQDTLNLLAKDKTDVPKIKDCLDMLIRAAEASGRDRDALSWILQYDEYISEGDPNWTAFTYRKALLYRKLGEQAKWREIVQGMITKKPDDLYNRMGASELEGLRLEQETQKFR